MTPTTLLGNHLFSGRVFVGLVKVVQEKCRNIEWMLSKLAGVAHIRFSVKIDNLNIKVVNIDDFKKLKSFVIKALNHTILSHLLLLDEHMKLVHCFLPSVILFNFRVVWDLKFHICKYSSVERWWSFFIFRAVLVWREESINIVGIVLHDV